MYAISGCGFSPFYVADSTGPGSFWYPPIPDPSIFCGFCRIIGTYAYERLILVHRVRQGFLEAVRGAGQRSAIWQLRELHVYSLKKTT